MLFEGVLVYNRSTLIEFNAFRLSFDLVTVLDTPLQLYNLVVMFIATPKTMSDYRFYLYLQTVSDLLFGIWYGFFSSPRIAYPGNCFISRGPFNSTVAAVRIQMILLFFFAIMTICAQHYSYLYRLIVIKFAHDGSVAERLNRKSLRFAGVVVMLVLSGFVTFGVYNISEDDEGVQQTRIRWSAIANQNFSREVWWCIDGKKIGWLCTISAFVVVSQLINLFGGIAIIRMIKLAKEKLTPDTYKMHMSLSVVLLIQGLIPFICIFIPLFHMTVMVMHFHRFYVSILVGLQPTLTKICIVMISLLPLINAILTIVFIKPYRNFAVKLAKRICCCYKARRNRDIVPLAALPSKHVTIQDHTPL